MICSTEGLVINAIKYGETSIISNVFTRELGTQAYLVRGVRKSKSKRKQYLFQPLTLVHMVASHKEKANLNHIKEIQLLDAYHTIPEQIEKTSLAIFLSEILSHALRNQEANETLFLFLRKALLHLDATTKPVTNYHLVFLLKLSKFLGFQPRNNYDSRHCFFNLQEGVFQTMEGGQNPTILNKQESQAFSTIAGSTLEDQDKLLIPKNLRKALLQKTIDYYRHHLAGMPEIKSHSVLETIFTG